MADSASPMRVIGWEEALLDAIAHHEAQPFEWGKSDCFIFPMDVVLALTGNDPWADERDYDSALSAARRLNKRGFENTGDAFAAKLESVPLALARRGDIGIADASQ